MKISSFLLFIFSFFHSNLGFSFPQNIAAGYTSCATCHVSPTGGGKTNAYGHLALESFIPDRKDLIHWLSDYREIKEEKAITGYDENFQAKLQYEIGGSLRALVLQSNSFKKEKTDSKINVIPMLFEGHFLGLCGKWSFFASFNFLFEKNYSEPLNQQKYLKPFSREHWAMYSTGNGIYFRLGRMSLPFGLLTADHTRPTRGLPGLGQQDQYYGASFHYVSEIFSLNFMPFYGNYLKQKRFQNEKKEKGAVLNFTLSKPRLFTFGFSSLYKKNKFDEDELDHSLNFQIKLPASSYLLSELTHQFTFFEENDQNFAAFLRVGKYFDEWLDLYLEYHEMREKDFNPKTHAVRLGSKGRVFPWLELEPFIQYKLSHVNEKLSQQDLWIALQIHAFF